MPLPVHPLCYLYCMLYNIQYQFLNVWCRSVTCGLVSLARWSHEQWISPRLLSLSCSRIRIGSSRHRVLVTIKTSDASRPGNLSLSSLCCILLTMSGRPTCLGCGRQFKSTRQLSSHAAQCGHNMSVKLTDSIYEKPKKCRSDKHSKKRPRIEDSDEIVQDGIQHICNDGWVDPPDDDVPVSISFIASHNIHKTL